MRTHRADWVYLGDKAARIPALTPGQVNYAITLRRQLADRLAKEASRRALANLSAAGREWSRIANIFRSEVRRMERADQRLSARFRAQGGV